MPSLNQQQHIFMLVNVKYLFTEIQKTMPRRMRYIIAMGLQKLANSG